MRIATIIMQVNFLPPDFVIRLSDHNGQQQRMHDLTKISQNENPTIPSNIKVVIWIIKYE
jgi:hypothetical protein